MYSVLGIGTKFIGDDVGGVNFVGGKNVLSTNHILMD